MAEALYLPDGDRFVPTELSRGPWSPDAQHGGPPAALLARAIERFEGGEHMHVARLTIELLRPVPLRPLAIEARWARPGRKVQLVAASLHDGETEVARAVGFQNVSHFSRRYVQTFGAEPVNRLHQEQV